MIYKIAADIVVLIHFVWIVFLFVGALWGLKHRAVMVCHLFGLVFALVLHSFDWYCPLTYLEIWLRSKHSPALTYGSSFIVYYVEKIVYVEVPRFVVFIVTAVLFVGNGYLYFKRRVKAGPLRDVSNR